MFVVVDGKLAGLVGAADPIKPTTAEAVRDLHAEGIRIVMLTGDSRSSARRITLITLGNIGAPVWYPFQGPCSRGFFGASTLTHDEGS
jgi:hypothetical protein